MKINFSIFLFVIFAFIACKSKIDNNNNNNLDGIDIADSSLTSLDSAVNAIMNDTSTIKLPKEIEEVFDGWLKNEIKKGNLLEECPVEYDSKEWQEFIENHKSKSVNIGGKVIESNRWAFLGISNVFYSDFNKDDKKDALIVCDLGQDCLHGNGYVGDPEVTIIVLSKGNSYEVDNSILDKFYKSLVTSKANRVKKFKELAYVMVENVTDGKIVGKYETWDNNEFAGNNIMQFRGNYSYDITKNSTTISNEEKIKYTEY